MIDNEDIIRDFNYNYRSKCIKLEINLKAMAIKKLKIQMELLKFLKLKLNHDLKNDGSECDISDKIYSYLDNYFEPDFTRKKILF